MYLFSFAFVSVWLAWCARFWRDGEKERGSPARISYAYLGQDMAIFVKAPHCCLSSGGTASMAPQVACGGILNKR